MASEKLKGILHGKNAPFSPEQLAAMTAGECWRWLYTNFPPQTKNTEGARPFICFMGFTDLVRTQLEDTAKNQFQVAQSVTPELKFLVTSFTPGQASIKKAKAQNLTILTEEQYYEMLATGARPEEKPAGKPQAKPEPQGALETLESLSPAEAAKLLNQQLPPKRRGIMRPLFVCMAIVVLAVIAALAFSFGTTPLPREEFKPAALDKIVKAQPSDFGRGMVSLKPASQAAAEQGRINKPAESRAAAAKAEEENARLEADARAAALKAEQEKERLEEESRAAELKAEKELQLAAEKERRIEAEKEKIAADELKKAENSVAALKTKLDEAEAGINRLTATPPVNMKAVNAAITDKKGWEPKLEDALTYLASLDKTDKYLLQVREALQHKPKPKYVVELNDGTKIECLSLMDVNGELTLKTAFGGTWKISAADVKAKTPVR